MDECSTGQHECDVPQRAICNNTHGSYMCHCRHGYCGEDGQNCKGKRGLVNVKMFWREDQPVLLALEKGESNR